MKNMCFLLCATFFILESHGQEGGRDNSKVLQEQKGYNALPSPRGKLVQPKNNFMNTEDDRNDMPVVKPKLQGKYLRNNGRGSDVYAMMPYNMPCLVPDSSFSSNMPVKKMVMKNQPAIELRKEGSDKPAQN